MQVISNIVVSLGHFSDKVMGKFYIYIDCFKCLMVGFINLSIYILDISITELQKNYPLLRKLNKKVANFALFTLFSGVLIVK